ncbi:MAG TPA: ABC transporter ATP-binding protein [Anaerolineaceae bacterium]|nr:ABC transporter ATP-binding protein [Anaerolineaceae bacterium]
MLEIDAIAVSLAGRSILKNVSLNVAPGEVVTVVGPNGAGKSTLLRAVSGALPLSAGCVRVGSTDIRGLRPHQLARRLAVVSQARSLPGAYTVEDTVLLGRTAYMNWLGQPGEKDRLAVQNALALTQTDHLAHRVVGELSGGEQQRVLLARALAQETPLLLLDEPATYLDLQHQSNLLSLLRRLALEKSLAVLMVLHELSLAGQYSDRIALLNCGRLQAVGAPNAVLTAENLTSVFSVPIQVIPHPDFGTPLVIPDGRADRLRATQSIYHG